MQFAENYNHLAAFYGEDTARLDENGTWIWPDAEMTAHIYLSDWSEKAPEIRINTDEDGCVTSVTAYWHYAGEETFAPWPLLRMQLLSMAFGVQEEPWIFCRVVLPHVLSQEEPFSSFSQTAGNVQLQCRTYTNGFSVADSFALSQDADASCCIVFRAVGKKE